MVCSINRVNIFKANYRSAVLYSKMVDPIFQEGVTASGTNLTAVIENFRFETQHSMVTSQLLYRLPGLSAFRKQPGHIAAPVQNACTLCHQNTTWSHRSSCTECLVSLSSEHKLVTSQFLFRMPGLSAIRTQPGHIAAPVQNAWTVCHQPSQHNLVKSQLTLSLCQYS